MKCSPFSRRFRKEGKYMHHNHGRFVKHMRRGMDGYGSSSCSSDDEFHRELPIESSSDMPSRIFHHGMKHGYKRKHGHGMRHGMNHHHGMMQGKRHHHGMMHGMGHPHGMMHGKRHPRGMMHEMGHDHGMKHLHDKEHGKKHSHYMEHIMMHRHGMKHKMHHGHGRKHKMGHGPGMPHKLRRDFEKSCSYKQNEERSVEVDIRSMHENSESEAFTFYKPKTSAEVMKENKKFQITLNTSYYQPEEVSVKIADGKIDISAMHESMEESIYEFHEMYRSFDIPNNVDPEVITARLVANGNLIIEAPCSDQGENSLNEQDIPVVRVSE